MWTHCVRTETGIHYGVLDEETDKLRAVGDDVYAPGQPIAYRDGGRAVCIKTGLDVPVWRRADCIDRQSNPGPWPHTVVAWAPDDDGRVIPAMFDGVNYYEIMEGPWRTSKFQKGGN